jgi:hypothetical protein
VNTARSTSVCSMTTRDRAFPHTGRRASCRAGGPPSRPCDGGIPYRVPRTPQCNRHIDSRGGSPLETGSHRYAPTWLPHHSSPDRNGDRSRPCTVLLGYHHRTAGGLPDATLLLVLRTHADRGGHDAPSGETVEHGEGHLHHRREQAPVAPASRLRRSVPHEEYRVTQLHRREVSCPCPLRPRRPE